MGYHTVNETSKKRIVKTSLIDNISPNPFSGSLSITFTLPETAQVKISAVNSSGLEVISLLEEEKEKGVHTITWNGTDPAGSVIPNGAYLLLIRTRGHSEIKSIYKIT